MISMLVVHFNGELLHHKITLNAVPFSLMGVALAIFLGFRNSASYDRYWEARKLWGQLAIECRNFARQIHSLELPGQLSVIQYLIAFVHTLRHQLRDSSAEVDWQRLLTQEDTEYLRTRQGPASALLLFIAKHLHDQKQSKHIDSFQWAHLDVTLNQLSNVLGGCERIANTPLPFTYSVILHRTVYLYCMLLPFGLLDGLGLMTPVMVTLVAYTFFAVEALSDEIEEPFGMLANDLPLHALSQGIEISVREILGQDIGHFEMIQPKEYLLH